VVVVVLAVLQAAVTPYFLQLLLLAVARHQPRLLLRVLLVRLEVLVAAVRLVKMVAQERVHKVMLAALTTQMTMLRVEEAVLALLVILL
jgi:hypothetical protein